MHRNITFGLVLFLVAISVLACKEKTKTYKPTTTIIEGVITSAEAPVIILKGTGELRTTIDQNGKFFIQAELDKAGIYTLQLAYQTLNVFIVPGDRISLTSEFRNFTHAAQFKGDHAYENNYLVAFEKAKEENQPKDYQAFYSQKEADFIKSIEDRTQALILDQQEFQKKNGAFDEQFAEMINEEITFDAALMKINYPTYYEYFNPESKAVLSDTFDSFLQNIEIDNDDNLLLPSFQNFLPLYLEFKSKSDTIALNEPHAVKKFKNIALLFQASKVKELLYYQLLKEYLDMSVNDAALVMDEYSKLQTNTQYNDEINAIFNTWRPLLKGMPAPGWEYVGLKGKKISLEQLKGKVVYIDLWATWCGPCLRELPYLEKLQEEFKKSTSIVFVSISIDEHKEAWEAMVKQKSMKGLQLFADRAWNSKIVSDYRVTGIPRFLIIGKDGNILNANAPRPSSKELKEELESALRL